MRPRPLACTTLVLLATCAPVAAADAPDYSAIDKHASAATATDEASLPALAKYLGGPCKTDADKARVVYRWVTDRIAYEVEGLKDPKKAPYVPADVLKARRAVCTGSAALYADLAQRLGLEAVVIDGHAKGLGHFPGQPLDRRTAHAWNAVKVDGRWQFVEPTWGAGSVSDNKFVKGFAGAHFFTPPDQFVFAHFPNDPKWQLLDKPLTKEQFVARPNVDAAYFALGISPADVLAAALDKSFAGLPDLLPEGRRALRSVKVPLNKRLKSGDEVTFELSSEEYVRMAVLNAGPTLLTKDGNRFVATVTLEKGELVIAGSTTETGEKFEVVLRYTVE